MLRSQPVIDVSECRTETGVGTERAAQCREHICFALVGMQRVKRRNADRCQVVEAEGEFDRHHRATAFDVGAVPRFRRPGPVRAADEPPVVSQQLGESLHRKLPELLVEVHQHVEAPHDVGGFRHQRLEIRPDEAQVRALVIVDWMDRQRAPVVLHVQRRISAIASPTQQLCEERLEPPGTRLGVPEQRLPAVLCRDERLEIQCVAALVVHAVVAVLIVNEVLGKRSIHAEDVPLAQGGGTVDGGQRREAAGNVQQPAGFSAELPHQLVDPHMPSGQRNRRDASSPAARQQVRRDRGEHLALKGREVLRRHPGPLHQRARALQERARVFAVRQRLETLDRRRRQLTVEATLIQILDERRHRHRRAPLPTVGERTSIQETAEGCAEIRRHGSA